MFCSICGFIDCHCHDVLFTRCSVCSRYGCETPCSAATVWSHCTDSTGALQLVQTSAAILLDGPCAVCGAVGGCEPTLVDAAPEARTAPMRLHARMTVEMSLDAARVPGGPEDWHMDAMEFAGMSLESALERMGMLPLLHDSDVIDLDGLDASDVAQLDAVLS